MSARFKSALSYGFVAFIYCIAFVLCLNGTFSKLSEEITYVVGFTLIPLVSVVVTTWHPAWLFAENSKTNDQVVAWNFLFIAFCCVYTFVMRIAINLELFDISTEMASRGVMAFPLLHAVGLTCVRRGLRPKAFPKLDDALMATVLGIVAISIFFPGILSPQEIHPIFWNPPPADDLCIYFLETLAIAGLYMIVWRFSKKKISSSLLIGGAYFFVVLSFDINMVFDFYHHGPWLGPAIRMAHGGWPLINYFCQYGLVPPMIWGVFLKAFPEASLYLSGFVSALFFMVNGLVFTTLLFRAIKNPWLAFAGSVVAVWFHHLSPQVNDTMSPSMGWGRYFPDLVLLLSLTYLKPGERFRWFTVSTLLFAGFWSSEIMGFCTLAYTGLIVARGIFYRDDIGTTIRWSLVPLVLVLSEHAVYGVLARLVTGQWPDYMAYWGIMHSHVTNSGTDWLMKLSPDFYTWTALFAAYFTCLVYLGTILFSRRNISKAETKSQWLFVSVILPAAILGILEATYFVGRSIAIDLIYCSWFPFMAVFFVSADHFLAKESPSSSLARITKASVASVTIAMLLLCVARMNEPWSAYRGNSSLLGWCMSSEGCSPVRLYNDMKQKLVIPTYLQPLPSGEYRVDKYFGFYHVGLMEIGRDAIGLTNKYAPNESSLNLFLGDVNTMVFFYTRKQHRLTISNPPNDSLSSGIMAKTLNEARELKEGDLIFFHPALVQASAMDATLMSYLSDRWAFCTIDQSPMGVVVARLGAKHRHCHI